ncbi:hypothetical protein MKEN_01134900 [Mycena kentingensis (nom. inval.)]|nr:hypothetical protein MKEN_01134900 [Mycena kentingensis (nom. inval.)]
MSYSGIFGLYYHHEHRFVSLPLLNVHAEASIKELAAQVKLTQTYGNDAAFPIEATYTFPIPARAAVCSFVMIKQDGTRVVGVVQEKDEARETYDTAVAAGQQASLAEQQSPDVFQVSVGNIPPKEKVEIELIYATELAEDEESDSARFHIPMYIGARYGHGPEPPKSNIWISSSSPTPFLTLGLNVEATAPISKIGSPSHTVSTELGPDPGLPNFKELSFSNYARVSLSSDSTLDKDFVLTIKSAGLDAPRCIAEAHPKDNSLALGLTFVPRFKLPDVSRQEFVLLVDRSGSMDGRRIEAAKKALVVMLRAIPHQDSLFQIASFGSGCSFLWPEGSKPYSQETLEQATRHVDSMGADFGGTEIRTALESVFRARKTDRPLSVLMLTDGDAWDLDGVLNEVKNAVEGAPKDAYIRVSVLGIGNGVSTAMCEGIARLGNGSCMLVGEEESSFTGKISRMLKAAKTPPIVDIRVDWGRSEAASAAPVEMKVADDFELVEGVNEKKTHLNIFDQAADNSPVPENTVAPPVPPVALSPPPYVQQAPFTIKNLFPNVRLNIYAILQDKTVPETVTIRGRTMDGADINLPIPVTLSHLSNTPSAPPAVHALAARKIIQDLEDGRHEISKTLPNPEDSELLRRTVKAMIVRLGKTYSIASTHTSFVAVDESKPEKVLQLHLPPPQPTPVMYSAHVSVCARSSFPTRMRHVPIGGFGRPGGALPPPPPMAMAMAPAPLSAPTPFGGAPAPVMKQKEMKKRKVSAGPSLDKASGSASYIAPSCRSVPFHSVSTISSEADEAEEEAVPQSGVSSDPLEALARMQSFDGGFSLQVLDIVKLAGDIQTVRSQLPNVSDPVCATLIAMAFLANKLGADVERDAWEGMYEKALEFVESALRQAGCADSANALEGKVLQYLM